jgi:hypothetical protein
MLDQVDQTTMRLPTEVLHSMELPQVPKNLKHVLSISWKGRGVPAPSAVAALTDKKGYPMVTLTLLFGRKVIEEEHNFYNAVREFDIFREVAEEIMSNKT